MNIGGFSVVGKLIVDVFLLRLYSCIFILCRTILHKGVLLFRI